MTSTQCKPARSKAYWREIISLGIPIVLSQLGIIVTGYADTLMVGHYGTDELASASLVNNLMTAMLMLSVGFSYGLTPLVAGFDRTVPKGDRGFWALFRGALRANVVFAALPMLVLGLVGVFIDRLGQPENLLPLIRPYFWINYVSMVCVVLFNVLRQMYDGTGRVRLTMVIMVSCNALNVLLNYLLIYGKWGMPEMGLTGAGLATLIARIAMLATGALLLGKVMPRRAESPFPAEVRDWQRKVHRNSWPVALQIGMETSIFTMATVMAGWLGECELAAYQLLVMIGQLGFMVYYSFGASMSIKIAYHHGRGHAQEVVNYARSGYRVILCCAVLASAIFLLFGEQLAGMFTTDIEVIALTAGTMVPLTLYQFGDATQIAFANALRGISHVKPMMRWAFLSYIVVGIPSAYVLAFPCGLRLDGIYYSFFVALLMAGLLFAWDFWGKMRENRISPDINAR